MSAKRTKKRFSVVQKDNNRWRRNLNGKNVKSETAISVLKLYDEVKYLFISFFVTLYIF